MDGVIVLNKPAGWTSHDAVAKLRRLARTRRVGHLGTLDPMATGVLPLVIERATRLARFYTKASKSYEAVVRFGFATTTYDAEGEATAEERLPWFSKEQLEDWLARFRGTFMQTPPPVSAKKIGGVRAYKLARKNVTVDVPPVEVTISSVQVTSFSLPEVSLSIDCAGGTYVRSVAHDLGVLAGCGAHLSRLVRTRSGDFTIDRALTLERLETMSIDETLVQAIIPASELLPEFPVERVDDVTAGQIKNGREFRVSPFRLPHDAPFVKAVAPDGHLLAIGEMRAPQIYHPVIVF